MATQQKKQAFVDAMLARGESPDALKRALASRGETLDGLTFEAEGPKTLGAAGSSQSANFGNDAAGLAQKGGEAAARFLAPKSVEGFGDTLGTAAAGAAGILGGIDESAVNAADANFRLAQLLKQTTDPVKRQQLIDQIRKNQGSQSGVASEQVRTVNKTAKQVAAEGLGTLGTMAVGAQAPGGLVGRLAMGTATGAGAGVKQGLEQDMTAGEIAKRGVKGGVVGLATTAAVEGALAAVKGIYSLVNPPGAAMNRNLQVPKREVTAAIEGGYKSIGEKAAGLTDDAGNAVYHGNPKDIFRQAKGELSQWGDELDDLLKAHSDVQLTRQELTDRVLEQLKHGKGGFGNLTVEETDKAKYLIAHALDARQSFNPADAVEIKRSVDAILPDNVWDVIDRGDMPRAIVAKTNYLIRDTLRQMVNEKTADPLIQAANNRMSLAMDMRHLAAAKMAADMLKPFTGKLAEGVKHGAVYLANMAALQGLFQQLGRAAEVAGVSKLVDELGNPAKK